MRKTIFTLGLMLAAALSLTSCSKNEEVNFTPELKPSFELFANLESRTTNDGMSTKWAAGDAINVFNAVATSDDYKSDGSFSTADASGLFKGTLSETLDAGTSYDWYAFYPYTSQIETPANVSKGYVYIGCRSDKAQTQTGNNSMAHIAGEKYPLYGVAEGVAASAKPSITMSHASSLVEFVVKNGTGEDFVVESIAFTAPEDIVGTYYINFASEPVVYTKSGDAYVSSTATLTVEDGEEVTADGAMFYMGIKPFTAKASSTLTVKITTDKGTFEKSITLTKDTTFSAGLIKTLTVNVNELVVPDDNTTATFVFNQASGNSADTITRTDGPITCVVAKASGSNAPNEHKEGHLRFQAGNTMTISGATITNVQFEFTAADRNKSISANVGTYTKGTTSSTWTGSASEVVFTNDDGSQARVESVTVTYISTGQEKQTLSFDSTAVEATLGQPFTAPTLSGAKTTVTYSSSNTDVATVDASTGAVTLVGAGTTTITATAEATEDYFSATASYTLTVIDPNATVDYTTLNTSNVTLSTVGGTSAYTAKVKVDGHEYDAIKLGTSKKVGAWKVTVPAGTTKLHLHLAGWNGESVKVGVTGATTANLTLKSDAEVSGNGNPFNIKSDSSLFYHELTLSNVTEPATLTFTATSGNRFVVWGVNAEIAE